MSSLGIELRIETKITAENSAADNNASPLHAPLTGLPQPQAIHGAGPLPAPYWDP